MKILHYIADMLFPRLCPVCGRGLNVGEKYVCAPCMAQLPRTNYHTDDFNPVEQMFAGKVPVERATGYFFYERGSRHASILHDLKYHNQPGIGVWLGRQFALEIKDSGLLDGIDAITPVPLHRSKLARRGYNQSERIAYGISTVVGAPVVQLVKAVKGHETQTHKSQHERQLNIQGIFAATPQLQQYAGGHVLLVDDVITTGATLLSCAEAMKAAAPALRISVATLAVARLR